jgi:hypothetical protein
LRDESGKRVRANILSAKKLVPYDFIILISINFFFPQGAEKVIDARRRHFVGDIGMQAQLSEVVRALDWDPAN